MSMSGQNIVEVREQGRPKRRAASMQRRPDRRSRLRSVLDEFPLSAAERERIDHHRGMFACFWLAMRLPGHRGWRRNPPGSTERQAQPVIEAIGSPDR